MVLPVKQILMLEIFVGKNYWSVKYIATNYQAAVIGYNIVRSDRNRHGGRVVCYVYKKIIYTLNSDQIVLVTLKIVVIEILLPNTNQSWWVYYIGHQIKLDS